MKRRFWSVLVLAVILTGCGDRNDSSSQSVVSETIPFETTESVADKVEVVVESEPVSDKSEEQLKLEQKIIENNDRAQSDGEILFSEYKDFDGDGKLELIAVFGKDDGYKTLWFARGESTWHLCDTMLDTEVWLTDAPDGVFLRVSVPGTIGQGVDTTYISNSIPKRARVDGEFFTTPISYDEQTDTFCMVQNQPVSPKNIEERTDITYWYSFDKEKAEFIPYQLNEITKQRFLEEYAELSDSLAERGIQSERYILSESGHIIVNYIENDERAYLVYYADEGGVKEYASGKGHYTNYRSLEQQRLEGNILAKIAEVGVLISNHIPEPRLIPLMTGDLDGNGTEELLAVYGEADIEYGNAYGGELWYACGDNVQRLIWPMGQLPVGNFRKVRSGGDTLIGWEMLAVTDSASEYYVIEGDHLTNVMIDGFARMALIQNAQGEFRARHSTYDFTDEGMGHTWKVYWYYYDAERNTFVQYDGHEITTDEFFSYDGAQLAYDELFAENSRHELKNILLYDNGIICVNYYEKSENDPEDKTNHNKCFVIRHGGVEEYSIGMDEADEGHYITMGQYPDKWWR